MNSVPSTTKLDMHKGKQDLRPKPMDLLPKEIVQMIDLSAARAESGGETVRHLVDCGQQYQVGLITVLPAQTALARGLSGEWMIVKLGCDELDMVISLSGLISGRRTEVMANPDLCWAGCQPLDSGVLVEIKLLIALEGGGTRCRAVLMDRSGVVFASSEAGPVNTNFVTYEEARLAVRQAVQNTLRQVEGQGKKVILLASSLVGPHFGAETYADLLPGVKMVYYTERDVVFARAGLYNPHGVAVVAATGQHPGLCGRMMGAKQSSVGGALCLAMKAAPTQLACSVCGWRRVPGRGVWEYLPACLKCFASTLGFSHRPFGRNWCAWRMVNHSAGVILPDLLR